MEEKRKFPRFVVDVTVHWKKISGSGERTAQHISNVKDASLGGVCLVLHPGILVGDILQMDILLPGDKRIRTLGKVVWVNPEAHVKGRVSSAYEGGIQFLDMSDSDQKEINRFFTQMLGARSRK